MKPQALLGLFLLVLIVAAAIVVPSLRDRSAELARDKALTAQRDLIAYSPQLPQLSQRASVTEVAAQTLEDAARQFEKRMGEINKSGSDAFSATVARLEEDARRLGMSAPAVQTPNATPAALQRAAKEFSTSAKENDAMLQNLLTLANEAVSESATTLTVAQTQGMAEYAKAAKLQEQAQRIRAAQRTAENRAVDLGLAAKRAQGSADQYGGMQVGPILTGLRKDLDDISKRREESNQAVTALQAAVAERQAALAKIDSDLDAMRTQMLTLEQQGFQAGSDASFSAYRDNYQRISEGLRKLQNEEMVLRHGGRRGAQLVGDDPERVDVEGGEPVVGLEQLQRQLAFAEEAQRRLNTANASLDAHIKFVTASGDGARNEANRYVGDQARLDGEQQKALDQVKELNEAAFKLESEALKSAQAAVRAFGQSQQAYEGWVRAARELQSTADPQNQNARLQRILNDQNALHLGQSAEADARVLAARIQLDTIRANEGLLASMGLLAELNPKFSSFDRKPYETAVDTARQGAGELLKKAREIYEDKLGKANVTYTWAPLAGAAAVHHLLAQLDNALAEAELQKARESIAAAFKKGGEQNPYLAPYIVYRAHLGGSAPAPAPTPSEKPAEPSKEAAGG